MPLLDSYDVLILGPGGMKGFIELGSLKKFEDNGLLKNIKVFCGVSIGSIIALLLSCGYSIMEILEQAYTTNLLDIKNVDVKSMLSGLIKQDNFDLKIEKLIKDKLKISYVPNLLQFKEITGFEFSAITTIIASPSSHEVNLNYLTYPQLSVVKAAMMSSNIPGLFKKIKYNGSYYVDGGLSCPLPLKFYDNGINKILSISILTHASSEKVLDNIANYMYISINTPMLILARKYAAESSDKCTNLLIAASLDNPTSVKLNEEEKTTMFKLGYNEAKKLFIS